MHNNSRELIYFPTERPMGLKNMEDKLNWLDSFIHGIIDTHNSMNEDWHS